MTDSKPGAGFVTGTRPRARGRRRARFPSRRHGAAHRRHDLRGVRGPGGEEAGPARGVSATVNLATGRARVEHPPHVALDELISTVERAGLHRRAPGAARRDSLTVRVPGRRPIRRTEGRRPSRRRTADDHSAAGRPRARALDGARPGSSATGSGCASRWRRRSRSGAPGPSTAGAARAAALRRPPWTPWSPSVSSRPSPGLRTRSSAAVRGCRACDAVQPAARPRTAGACLSGGGGRRTAVRAHRPVLEARARRGTGSALRALAELGAKDVRVREERGGTARIPVTSATVGRTSWSAPARGSPPTVWWSRAVPPLDLSLVTGESEPVEVGPGTAVVGGAVNSGGLLLVRATAVGADTQLARITRLVTEAQAGKARMQRLADTVAGVFVPVSWRSP